MMAYRVPVCVGRSPLAALALTVALCGGSPAYAEDLGTLNVMMSTPDLVLYLPAQLGPDEGKFETCGVKVRNIMGSSATVSPSILSGESDIAVQFGGRAVGDIMQGVPAKVVAAQTPRWVMPLTISNALYQSGVHTSDDLAKRVKDGTKIRFGITSFGAATHFSLLKVIAKFGWTDGKEYEFVALGGINEIVAALQAGKIDAFVYNRDVVQLAQDKGLAHILNDDVVGDSVGPTIKEAIMASDKLIKERPKALVAYLECYFKYVNELKADPDQARKLAISKMRKGEKELDASLKDDIKDWSADGSATPEQLKGLAAGAVFQNKKIKDAPVEKWWVYWKDLKK